MPVSIQRSCSTRIRLSRGRDRILEALETRVLLSAIPAPLIGADIGTPTGGSDSFDQNTGLFTVVGAGHDIVGASDAFHYVYEPMDGDGTITVKIDSDSVNGGQSLAGLDIRSSLSPTASNVFIAARDDGSVFVNSRDISGTAGGTNNGGQAGSFSELLRLTRVAGDVEAFVSNDNGMTFQNLASTAISFPTNRVFVGLAVASQNAPGSVATATFQDFTIDPATGPTATATAPNVVGRQVSPYQFTVTYNSGVAIDTTTLSSSDITITAPDSSTPAVTLLSAGIADDTTVTATYQIVAPTQAGVYQISMNNAQVSDVNGNSVPSGSIGTFNLTADAAPPTATLSSAPAVFANSASPYQFTVTYHDNGIINVATIGNNNLLVQLPDGSTEAATLVTNGLTSGSTEVATYQIPAPTANGKYTVKTASFPIADSTGNQEAAATLGTFQVNISNTVSGNVKTTAFAGISGATVFADLNGNKILDGGEPSTTTDSSGNYSLTGLVDGSYSIVESNAAQQVIAPASGVQSVTVAGGQTVAGVNFVNTSANNISATANLIGAFRNNFKGSVRAGSSVGAMLRITNNGTGKATGFVNVTLLLTTDGTAATAVTTLKTARVKLNLAKGKFVGLPVTFKFPAGTVAGTYKVVAVVDSGNAVSETNELDNVFSSTAITIHK